MSRQWLEREGIFELRTDPPIEDRLRHNQRVDDPSLMHVTTKLFDLVKRVVEALPPHEDNILAIKLARDGLEDAARELETMGLNRLGSGRTHRMLVEAIAFAASGRSVLVLGVSLVHCKQLAVRIEEMTIDRAHVRERIMVRPYTSLEQGGVLVGQYFSAILEDHAVTEARARDWASKKIALVGFGKENGR